jgi:hypothetical protein
VNVSDAIVIAQGLFMARGSMVCEEADCNKDGHINIADPVFLVNYLFRGGAQPPQPSPACGSIPDPKFPIGCGDGENLSCR